ncbi:MAG TPA: alpha/beta hydrolase [Thermoleophilaceae bacterium]|nr:alpha/beta hydrolase [Thermoleophilaceae bacterium]
MSRPVDWRAQELGERRTVSTSAGPLVVHEAGAGRPLVFVHGFLANANIWRGLVPELRGRFRCVCPDWPLGSHFEPMREDADLSPPGIAALIRELLERLELDDAALVGNDSGGAYSQIAAAERPDRLGALVLCSCETPDDRWPPRGFGHLKRSARVPGGLTAIVQGLRVPALWRMPGAYGPLSKRPIEKQVMHSFLDPFFGSAAIRRDARRVIASVGPEHSRAAADRLRSDFDRPILLAWGADDVVFPLRHAEAYARSLPDARVEAVPDARTYVAHDNPAGLAAVLTAAL